MDKVCERLANVQYNYYQSRVLFWYILLVYCFRLLSISIKKKNSPATLSKASVSIP